jgi:hypothetical protein
MTRGTLVLIVLGALAGCAGMKPATVDDARVARLPAEEKADLVARQQRVTTAESNVDAAKVAVNEAKQFRDMAKSEVDAAQARFDAAQKALSLGAQTRSERTLVAGRDAAEAAQAELSAAQAKKMFADRLVELRQAQVDEAQATLRSCAPISSGRRCRRSSGTAWPTTSTAPASCAATRRHS